ncbi:MAG: hypothetical protein IAE97_08030 [Chthoniobacterales bacterium]|nr:hypothetical protein [Chthoniobacterales bacterium]
MKKLSITLAALASTTLISLAGSIGPGPWANGAYYPDQFDGRYSANVYNNTDNAGWYPKLDHPTNPEPNTVREPGHVVSGVLGFGLRNGTPTVGTNNRTGAGTFNAANTVETITLDSSHNYFVIYINGDVFAGQTIAGVNISSKTVNGSLWNGLGRSTYERVTNLSVIGTNAAGTPIIGSTVSLLAIPGASAGGYFNAKIKNDKAVFTFKGPGEISVREATTNAAVTVTYPYQLSGIKVSQNSASGYQPATTTATE